MGFHLIVWSWGPGMRKNLPDWQLELIIRKCPMILSLKQLEVKQKNFITNLREPHKHI